MQIVLDVKDDLTNRLETLSAYKKLNVEKKRILVLLN